jgi:rhodanese-related sulfurtransferase
MIKLMRKRGSYIIATGILCASLLVAITVSGINETNNQTFLASVSSAEFSTYLNTHPTIIDVRTAEEFKEGHLPGAINIDFYNPNFKENLSKLDQNKEFAIYCRSGNRSGQTLAIMSDLGFKNVRDLSGGIKDWVASGQTTCTNC